MDHTTSRPPRRDDRPCRPIGWARAAALGLAMAAAPVPSKARSGEPERADVPKARVAAAPHEARTTERPHDAAADPVARALRLVADCKAKYRTVEDYTCTFFKRERVDGKLYTPHVMTMKARTGPESLYFKFIQPNAGREAIYVKGRYNDKIVAHDVGLGRVVAGTMHLDPKGDMAMEENRHPVSEAGIGSLIDTIEERWKLELRAEETRIIFHANMQVGDRPCVMVATIHAGKDPRYMFHKVKFFVDRELGLPIRFEAFDWPARPGAAPELMEEYTYANLRINVGLKDRDFDPKNSQYAYGRF